jgi:hypothetical protein
MPCPTERARRRPPPGIDGSKSCPGLRCGPLRNWSLSGRKSHGDAKSDRHRSRIFARPARTWYPPGTMDHGPWTVDHGTAEKRVRLSPPVGRAWNMARMGMSAIGLREGEDYMRELRSMARHPSIRSGFGYTQHPEKHARMHPRGHLPLALPHRPLKLPAPNSTLICRGAAQCRIPPH